MVHNVRSISRRSILAAGLGTVIMPAMAQDGNDPPNEEPTEMQIRMTFHGQALTGTLYDNASTRDLLALLPLDIEIE